MKMTIAVAVSAAFAFTITYAFVPRRAPELVPPSWFEVPGVPLTVDGREVHDWHEANEVLRELARTSYDEACREASMQGTKLPIEAEGRTIRITYASRRAGLLGGSIPQESVLVRPFLPKTIEYSRSGITELARYEIVRDDFTQ